MMKLNKLKFAALMAAVLLLNFKYVNAEDNWGGWLVNLSHTSGVKPISDKTYKEECGSCHFAYQPGLLPAKSWEKLLTAQGLHNHFGEIADLDKDTLQVVLNYAVENSADKSFYKRSRKITVATEGVDAPLRITDVRYIKRKHHKIPEVMIKGNKDVKSLSYCNACHTKAENGIFEADTVSIPNYPGY
jgi:hypothetical protein